MEAPATPSRHFTLLEITSGLPDDSREADEKAAARQLLELRVRVKRPRAVVAATPGLAEVLRSNWQKAAQFYARLGISETQFRAGIAPPKQGVFDSEFTSDDTYGVPGARG